MYVCSGGGGQNLTSLRGFMQIVACLRHSVWISERASERVDEIVCVCVRARARACAFVCTCMHLSASLVLFSLFFTACTYIRNSERIECILPSSCSSVASSSFHAPTGPISGRSSHASVRMLRLSGSSVLKALFKPADIRGDHCTTIVNYK